MEGTSKAKEIIARMKATMARAKERTEMAARTAFQTAETVGTAFGMGYVNGRMGDVPQGSTIPEYRIANVPVDLAAGGLLAGAAMLGLFGKEYDGHVVSVGNGSLAAWGTRQGLEMGIAAKNQKTAGVVSGHMGAGMPGYAGFPGQPAYAHAG